MPMRLTKYEQETIILFNESESTAAVYTYNTGLQNTLNSLYQSHPEQVTQTGDNGYGGLTYSLPKKWVKIAPPRVLSEAQKKVLEDMNRKNKERRQWIAVLIFLVVVIIFNISSREYSTSSKGNNRIENYGSNKGPSQTKAMAGVRVYLKRHYLKDPDSYEGISWEAFGIYNKDNNTYFALHKYRAKNSYGGYVVEEKLFVLDSDGNVIKVVDDMNEVINGY